MVAEDYALVLDFLPQGKGIKREPQAQLIGTSFFTLLEAKPKGNLDVLEKVYIGKEKREKIELIRKRILFKDLSSNANSELNEAINRIIDENHSRFVDFFNNARSISIRLHQIDLLPGIGKKHLEDFIAEREKGEFKSFEDINKRVKSMPNSKSIVIKRIIQELEGEEKYYFFVRRPATQTFERNRFQRKPFRQ